MRRLAVQILALRLGKMDVDLKTVLAGIFSGPQDKLLIDRVDGVDTYREDRPCPPLWHRLVHLDALLLFPLGLLRVVVVQEQVGDGCSQIHFRGRDPCCR